MKITHIDITSSLFNQGKLFLPLDVPSYQYDKISLPLEYPDPTAPFILKAAEGLEMPDLRGNLGNRHAHMNFGALSDREISLLIELNPYSYDGRSASDLRDDFYRIVVSPGDAVLKFSFMNNDILVGSIEGHVSRLETATFTSRPEILLAISCRDPFIRGEAEDWESLDASHLIASREADGDYLLWDSKSTAPHGFKIVLECVIASPNFELITTYQDLSQTSFVVETSFSVGDKLTINSIYGQMSVIVSRKGSPFLLSVGDKIAEGSSWPVIYPNYNLYTFPVQFGDHSFSINSFIHYPSYWGV